MDKALIIASRRHHQCRVLECENEPVVCGECFDDGVRQCSEAEKKELRQEIGRLEQCHREGWRYAKEIEDEYRKRTGHGFAVEHGR